MNNIIDDLVLIERRCKRGAAPLETDEVKAAMKAIAAAADELERAWSGSWIGYHARVYYGDFETPPPGAVFSAEWGFMETMVSNPTCGDWKERSYEEAANEILRRAGNPDLEQLEVTSATLAEVFTRCQEELLATLDAVLADNDDRRLREIRDGVSKIKAFISAQDFARVGAPRQFQSRDMTALYQGVQVPAHVGVRSQAASSSSRAFALRDVEKHARQARLYLEKRMNLKGKSVARTEGTVFIGHGRSTAWRDLKDLLQDRLGLTPDEFNLESAAGLATTERLEEMLDAAVFAFLVMTAEDEHADHTHHARENVVHEAGLFQGRLGFRRAIVLLEEGCSEFSNIEGLGQIRFPHGNIKAKSEEIRQVLEREGLLPGR